MKENHHTEVQHEAAGGAALPQMRLETFPSQIFWLVISFSILYLVMSRVTLPRIAGVIQEREDKISDDLDSAQEMEREAQKLEKDYHASYSLTRDKARAVVEEAVSAASKEAEEKRAHLSASLKDKIDEAEERIKEERKNAGKVSIAIAEQILPDVTAALFGKKALFSPEAIEKSMKKAAKNS